MAPDACNLLVTHDLQHAASARDNVRHVLAHLGASGRFLEVATPGAFALDVPGDARLVVRAAADRCRHDAPRFAHTHHWRPVDAWVRSELREMTRAVERLAPRIGPEDPWRLTLAIHGPSRWRTADLVPPLTEPIRRGRVQLVHAVKELRVDLLGDHAAIALLEPGDDLSVDTARRLVLTMAQDV